MIKKFLTAFYDVMVEWGEYRYQQTKNRKYHFYY